MLGKSDGVPKTPRVGRERVRHPGPRDPRAGARVGRQEDHARRRRPGRLGRRLPRGHRQRVGPHHDRPRRHAGHGQAGQQHLGHHAGRARRLRRSCFPGYAEGGISGDFDNSAAGYPLGLPHVRRQRRHRLATRTTPPRARHVPRLRIPEAMMARAVSSGAARASAARSIEPSSRKYQYPAAGLPARADVLPLRRLVHRHHDRDQPLRAAPTARASSPSSSTSPSGSRARPSSPTSSCRPAPTSSAGTSASSANCSGYIPDNFNQMQPPRHRAAAEVHRAAGRVQVRLRDLRRSWPSGWASATIFTEGGKTELDWVKRILPRHRPAQAHHLGGVREEGLLRGAGRPRTTSRRRPCAGSPRAASATRPTGARALATPGRPARACRRHRGKIEFVASSLKRFEDRTSSTPSGRPWPAVHPELGGPPHRRALREVPAAA